MKKIISLLALSALLFSCSVDSVQEESNFENLEAPILNLDDTSSTGIYKGVFTTADSEMRATFSIVIPRANNILKQTSPIAIFKMIDGTTHTVNGELNAYKGGTINKIQFQSTDLSFNFSVNGDGTNPVVENVLFTNKASFAMVQKETSRAPVTPITGTYTCTTCNDHPTLNTFEQSFNLMFTGNATTSDVTTAQIVYDNQTYSASGTQGSCGNEVNGQITCSSVSGSGTDLPGNTAYTYTGSHVYNTGMNDCSSASGTWQWTTINFGLIEGDWKSDFSCDTAGPFVELYNEDFNDFAGTGFVPNPMPGQLDSNVIKAQRILATTNFGDVLDANNNTVYARGIDTPGNATVGISAYNLGGNNRSLVVQPDGGAFTPGSIEIKVVNSSPITLTEINLRTLVQIANQGNRSNTIEFDYSLDDGATYQTFSGISTLSTPQGSDGNGLVTLASIDEDLTGLSLAPIDFIRIRITTDELGGSGGSDEISYDNIVVTGR